MSDIFFRPEANASFRLVSNQESRDVLTASVSSRETAKYSFLVEGSTIVVRNGTFTRLGSIPRTARSLFFGANVLFVGGIAIPGTHFN